MQEKEFDKPGNVQRVNREMVSYLFYFKVLFLDIPYQWGNTIISHLFYFKVLFLGILHQSTTNINR